MSAAEEAKKNVVKQVDRRTWDIDEYQRRADEKARERELEVSSGRGRRGSCAGW